MFQILAVMSFCRISAASIESRFFEEFRALPSRGKMFSLSRLGLCSGQQIVSGVRFFTNAVTQREIFDTLEKEYTIHTIPAFRREGDGKNYSRFLRKNGAIPGVLYGPDGKGHDERVLVYVPTSEVDRFMTRLNLSFESTLFYLDVEGERTLVFPRQLSCHPGMLVCC